MQIKKDYTREQIVTVAKRVFLRKGFAKASMRDVAKGAGIGLSNIYNYFNSKDEIFRHIVAPLIAKMEEMLKEHHDVRYHEEFLRYANGESDEMMTEHVQKYMQLISITAAKITQGDMPRKTDGIEFEIHPCLWKVRESRRWLYFPKKESTTE